MAQDRITKISNFLNYKEIRRSNSNRTKTPITSDTIREDGLSEKVIFVSSNLTLLKSTKQTIKGNVLAVLLNSITYELMQRVLYSHELCVIVFDEQTPREDNLKETLIKQGYEVYEY